MSPPPNGLYRLRYLPDPDERGVGGLYATQVQGRDKPINAAPGEPSLQGQQNWEVRQVGGDEVHILYAPQAPEGGIGGIGFSYSEDRPGAPIVLSFVKNVRAEELGQDTWRLRPVGGLLGVDAVIGLNEERHDETLVINAYPLAPVPRPAWQLEPVHRD
ncbi:unnamed protein product [Rhizoctonia solani]|uniref:Uncharacterized protein n=1 Tax=Rhizoctonia solani TaxID=456999 RepID=A0A8H3DJY0_9AGAM|nr:unnamed protein product [Rhizoctonia solani]